MNTKEFTTVRINTSDLAILNDLKRWINFMPISDKREFIPGILKKAIALYDKCLRGRINISDPKNFDRYVNSEFIVPAILRTLDEFGIDYDIVHDLSIGKVYIKVEDHTKSFSIMFDEIEQTEQDKKTDNIYQLRTS